jgi:hypothetical protein
MKCTLLQDIKGIQRLSPVKAGRVDAINYVENAAGVHRKMKSHQYWA